MARVCGSWRANELRHKPDRGVSAGQRLRRSHPQRHESCRPTRTTSDQVRVCDQPEDCESARGQHLRQSAFARRRGDRMKRRQFITLLGSAAASWPLVARAQQAGKLPTVGFLGSATPLVESQRLAAFVQRLRELGWIENRTVAIEYRWGEGRAEGFAEIAAEFVRLKVDLIVASTTPTAIAAKQATSTIPIVFVGAGDPVATGLVPSLARPGGNVTGLAIQAPDTSAKRLELLR